MNMEGMDYETICMEVLRQAGEALKKASAIYHASELFVEKKAHGDWVTYADRMVEADLIQWLREKYPAHGIVSEETFVSEETLCREAECEYVWYIDPIDGTTNYIRANCDYSVSVGLKHQGKAVLGAVISQDEAYAAAGLKLILPESFGDSSDCLDDAIIGFSPRTAQWMLENGGDPLALMSAAGGYRYIGSSALELCRLACGRLDLYFSTNLKSWDYTGALAVLRAAGAKAAVCHVPETLVVAWREDTVLKQALQYFPKGTERFIIKAAEECSC